MIFTVSRTYQETTEESAELGDFSDQGYVYQDCEYDLRELVRELSDCIELSGLPRDTHCCWASTGYDTDYRTGTDRSESVHISHVNGKRVTAHQLARIYRTAGLLKGTNWNER